jgi:23S rRNA (pseudouridine1915-N3)-methyltransferase
VKITLLVVGRTDAGFWADAMAEYSARVKHYVPFETEVVPDIKNARNLTEIQQRAQEGRLILNTLQSGDCVVLLDEHGKEMTSMQFARFLEKKLQIPQKRVVFVTGGPFGFSNEVYTRADEQLSLSKMTFSHQMIRAVFTEQLYRATTIIRGEKYHHE